MFSGRFDGADKEDAIRDLESAVRHKGLRTFIVNANAGDAFGPQTLLGLDGMAAMVAVCFNDYGWPPLSSSSFFQP